MRQDSISTRNHSLLTEIKYLVTGFNEAQFLYVSSQKEFNENKVIPKKWIYLERYRFQRKNEVREWPWKKHTPQTEHGPSQKARGTEILGD